MNSSASGIQAFRMSAKKLTLPKPYDGLTFVDIRCQQFVWQTSKVACSKGIAQIQTKTWQALTTDFSFRLTNTHSLVNLGDIKIGDDVLHVVGALSGRQWQVQLKSERLSYPVFEKLVKQFMPDLSIPKPKQGLVDIAAQITGIGADLLTISLTAKVTKLTVQTTDGKLASEKLDLLTRLDAQRQGTSWRWHSDSQLLSGALYVDPIYLEAGELPIRLTAQGVLHPAAQHIDITAFDLQHPAVLRLTGAATIDYTTVVNLERVAVKLHSDQLQPVIDTYVNPFFNESPFAGVTTAGELDADVTLIENQLIALNAQVNTLTLTDNTNRFAIKQASGAINWYRNAALPAPSHLQWRELVINGIQVESGMLKINSHGQRFTLAEPTHWPILGGKFTINHFDWETRPSGEPDVDFSGKVSDVSLEALSKQLGWTPLSGNISGDIPGINYHQKTLGLDGELRINVFGGQIKLNNLVSSGLLDKFSTLVVDIAIDNLDLEQLTRKFKFGAITGKLTGFVNNLQLKNWHPVSFYAWLGTPDDDDSSHKISQKAINNIAQIGGGGATDLLSRSFLGVFDTFRYNKIGVGCYLHKGVCQMSGVEAAEQGYYLIKGGCLPRIDVMGYNTQVNWDVLVERLARVASPDKAVIQ